MSNDERELPNLMQMRCFLRVADHGSITKAAKQLYRAQSVVTRSIHDLEQRLGELLFERQRSGVRLTHFGASVMPRTRRAFAELESVPTLLGQGRSAPEPQYLLHARRLAVFVKLCETHHMQTVASSFGMTQPAVSAALKVLEDGCGQKLFERSARGLQPTDACRLIAPAVRRALHELRNIDSDIAAASGTVQGRVMVGALPLGRAHILPEAILRVTAAHPRVRVATNESPFDLLAADLRAGDVDFVFGALRPAQYASDLEGETLLAEPLIVLARPDHPLAKRRVSSKALSRARWILSRAGSPSRALLDAYFARSGLPAPEPVVETADLAIIRRVLMRSDMLAAVSAHQLEHELAAGQLQRLQVQLEGTERDIGLMYRKSGLHSPAAAALMEQVRAVAREAMPISLRRRSK